MAATKKKVNATGASRRKRRKGSKLGSDLITALTQVAEALESGEALEKRFTVRTVERLPEPGTLKSSCPSPNFAAVQFFCAAPMTASAATYSFFSCCRCVSHFIVPHYYVSYYLVP